jgi:hypothetical protein
MNALTSTASRGSLEPSTMAEAMKVAELLAGSAMIPRDFQGKPANVLVAIQWGREIGLGTMQALQGIAVINGRPSLWGDSAMAVVRGHPACQSIREGVDGDGDARHGWCEVVRRGEEAQRRTFSVADAKRAGLWGKSGPWQQYPDRMLQLRARGFAIRDVFPDALRGVVLAEEAQDLPPEPPRFVANTATDPLRDVMPWAPTYIDAAGKKHQVRDVATWAADWMKRIQGAEKAGRLDDLRAAAERNATALRDVAERDAEAAAGVDAAIRLALSPAPAAQPADDFPGVVTPRDEATP